MNKDQKALLKSGEFVNYPQVIYHSFTLLQFHYQEKIEFEAV